VVRQGPARPRESTVPEEVRAGSKRHRMRLMELYKDSDDFVPYA
jgi:hypothetical protein